MHFWCGMAFLEDTQIISICLNCGGENGILILGCRLTRILKYEICLKNFYRAILTSHVSQILRGVIWERQPSIKVCLERIQYFVKLGSLRLSAAEPWCKSGPNMLLQKQNLANKSSSKNSCT